MAMRRKPEDLDLIWRHSHPINRSRANGYRCIRIVRKTGIVSISLADLTQAEFTHLMAYARTRVSRGAKPYPE
jgi:hypothetical protein